MDYSPYQNRSRRSQGKGGKISIGLFLMSAFIGFLLFWGIKSLFFTEGGELSPVSYLSNSSRAEIMIAGDTSWGNLTSGSLVTQGDEIRIKKGNTSELVLKNNSKITLGLGSQLKMGEVRASESGEIFGEIFLEKGSILLDLKPAFSDDQLKIWLSKDTYLKASEGKLLFDQEGIAAISGENFYIQKVDSDGKVRYSKVLGIAQYLRFDSFSLQGIPEKIKSNPLVSGEFASSEGLDNSENSDESNAGKNTPVLDLKSPIILEPVAHGEIKEVSKTKPFLGVCMGMQVLMEHSIEGGGIDCIGLYKGNVKHFTDHIGTTDSDGNRLKIPQMGWNKISHTQNHPLWNGIENNARFYFVHSYFVDPEDKSIIAGETDFGINYASAIAKDNVFAIQSHPEKSADDGLQLLKNFTRWNGAS